MNKNFYQMPNNIFAFHMNKYEIVVYSYLVCCAGKKKECWPSLTTISKVLGISKTSAYELVRSKGFPVLKIGSRMVVPKEKFREWVEQNTGGSI